MGRAAVNRFALNPFRRRLLMMCCLSVSIVPWARAQTPGGRIDTVVVCADELLQAAGPWLEYRGRQGHGIAVLHGSEAAEEIRQSIRDLSKHTELRFVVLIGDAPPETPRGTDVATFHVKADVISKWGGDASFASDNAFGDLDDDGVPDLAVGRMCADSANELRSIIAKILAYERSDDVRTWRRRVNLVAGVGGFGAFTDKVLETAAKKFLADGIPPEYQTSMTQASWRSSYSPDPRRFRAQTIEQMNQGCLAWVYLGHGHKRALDDYRVPGGRLPILSTADVPRISVREGAPFAVFLSCYAGAFDAEPNCLAEELLAAPGGPISVIAGSSVTMPYAMTIMGNAMLHELFVNQRPTLGEVLLHAKRELAREPAEDKHQFVTQLAAVLSPDPDLLHAERLEHVRLFHLIGDPLLRIRYPRDVHLTVPEYAVAGDHLELQGSSEVNGACVIELVCRRDRLRFKPRPRLKFEPTEAWLSELHDTYLNANNAVWVTAKQTIEQGTFSATLRVPEDAWGPCHVCVYVQGDGEFAMGSANVYLQLADRSTSRETPPANASTARQ